MTDSRQKEQLQAQWECCSSEFKIRIATTFIKGVKNGTVSKNWWHYLQKKLTSRALTLL